MGSGRSATRRNAGIARVAVLIEISHRPDERSLADRKELVILGDTKDLNRFTARGFTSIEILRASSSDALRMTVSQSGYLREVWAKYFRKDRNKKLQKDLCRGAAG